MVKIEGLSDASQTDPFCIETVNLRRERDIATLAYKIVDMQRTIDDLQSQLAAALNELEKGNSARNMAADAMSGPHDTQDGRRHDA